MLFFGLALLLPHVKSDNGQLQDDNAETKLRRNKLVVIVIDGWVTVHQIDSSNSVDLRVK